MSSTFSLSRNEGDGVTYDEATLEAMTKTQLLDLASELGVEGISSKSLKADIITAILNSQ